MSESDEKIIIKGVTLEGRTFRPSDWAQRLTTAVGNLGWGRRVAFHPKVQMATFNGINCVVVDKSLEEEDPMLFEFLMKFARGNNLQMETMAGETSSKTLNPPASS